MIFNISQDEMRSLTLDWIIDDNIIEIGCSDGNFASLLNIQGIKNYIGVDILKDKIIKAKKDLPYMNFICCDILKNLYLFNDMKTVVSFQCFEHIIEDLKILKSIQKGTKIILSVPNSPYKGHIRWYEKEGWKSRFSPYIDFDLIYTIQNPIKKNKRSFLFRGVRNNFI